MACLRGWAHGARFSLTVFQRRHHPAVLVFLATGPKGSQRTTLAPVLRFRRRGNRFSARLFRWYPKRTTRRDGRLRRKLQLEKVRDKLPLLYERDDMLLTMIQQRGDVERVSSRNMRLPLQIRPGGKAGLANMDGGDLGRGWGRRTMWRK